jgi:anti-sigma regulatory factor (Ser/Thr protein kinase)
MAVQRWVTASEIEGVADVRRGVVAYAAQHGVGSVVLADLAIAVSEVLTNVVRHGLPTDAVTTTAELEDGEVVVVIRGPGFGLAPGAGGPAAHTGMVIAAALAGSIRVRPTAARGREVRMSFPIPREAQPIPLADAAATSPPAWTATGAPRPA